MVKFEYLKETPSQTAGPYLHIGCTPNFIGNDGIYARDLGSSMVAEGAKGERIVVSGRIFDGAGATIKDAMVEIWQADADGLYNSPEDPRGDADPHFTGWGRQPVDMETGVFQFETIKPGQVPFPDGRMQAPHISLWIVARGINLGLNTRLYFADEDEANAVDPVLQRIEHKHRIQTLIAGKVDGGYALDIYLQGDNETVFFDL
ncbi:protocatechuate 3,4-dioxygenase subunit alpha [Pseudovibrio sp. SPO723]|uniref:protocatechuate 3,4-dioxygenase subunit alpha n=1 Tax=Nesiotobacter zosterae TaxID=392721 RepID=UPI0029C29C23|nr:protocatechuate 3,4-dioxygenase subunit alpha [Pseudovibrio sp. SPO723]MDX5595195.1 protocatechuate 3,4-dioxygenase subunit alpha [Pseudovibrio sp. SPO723]